MVVAVVVKAAVVETVVVVAAGIVSVVAGAAVVVSMNPDSEAFDAIIAAFRAYSAVVTTASMMDSPLAAA